MNRAFGAILFELMATTWNKLNGISKSPAPYDPANSLGGSHHLVVDIDDPTAEMFKDLVNEDQFPPGGNILQDPRRVFCYFARFSDPYGNRLLGMRRSSMFKGLVKQRNRVARLVDDTLHLEADTMFRLDNDFDLLVASDEVRILHPKGFESIGQLREVIRAAVPTNVAAIQNHLPFVDLGSVEELAGRNLRIARVLASVLQVGIEGITFSSLQQYCAETNVDVRVAGDRIVVEEGSVVDFLNALSRRRLSATLVPGQREVYIASDRHRV